MPFVSFLQETQDTVLMPQLFCKKKKMWFAQAIEQISWMNVGMNPYLDLAIIPIWSSSPRQEMAANLSS